MDRSSEDHGSTYFGQKHKTLGNKIIPFEDNFQGISGHFFLVLRFLSLDNDFQKTLSLHTNLAQWWEHSPPNNMAWVRFPVPASYVGWVVMFVVGSRSPFSERFFSGYSGFPLSSKNQHCQVPVRSEMRGHMLNELLSAVKVFRW